MVDSPDLAPKRTGKPVEVIELSGCLFPWDTETDQPVLVHMVGSGAFYLPVFSTEEKLRGMMKKLGPFGKIKMIQDGREFLDSVPLDVIVIKDAWHTLTGTVRFTQVQR
jgi:hypothetical protein